MIGDEFVFLCDYLAVEDLLWGLKLLLAVAEHPVFVHVYDKEGVGEYARLLHGEGLRAGFGETWQDETLLLFLNGLDFFLYQVDDYLILHQCELFEVSLDLFSER